MVTEPSTESVLRGYDLALMSTAVKWDLDDREHRKESNQALVELFFRLVELAGPDLFVEAGAKDATASRRARTLLPDARVIAFEANPFTYRRFATGNKEAGVEYVHRALTDTPGEVTFHVLRNAQGAPIGNGQASLLQRTRDGDAERGFEEVTVQGVRLDDVAARQPFERAAMWVDVEGACALVLPGARAVLGRTDVLVIEVEDRNDWGPEHWLREQVVDYLFELGLVPVARDFEYPNQFNIVFVRDTLTADAAIRRALTRFVSRAVGPSPDPTFPQRARGAVERRVRARTTAARRAAARRRR